MLQTLCVSTDNWTKAAIRRARASAYVQNVRFRPKADIAHGGSYIFADLQLSPVLLARLAGLFELLEALTSGFGQVIVPRVLYVSGDAAATASNITTHESLYDVSIVAAAVGVVCHIAWVLLFYELLKPVSRRLSLAAMLVGLVAIALQAACIPFQLAPLEILNPAQAHGGFTAEQTNGLALMFMQLYTRAFNLYLVIFGVWCVLVGVLITGSGFLPRLLGFLELVAGLCWLSFLWLPLAHILSPYNQVLAGLGELSLTFWLLVMGVNAKQWQEKAHALATCE